MTIVLIRHTRVVIPPGLCYGRCDVPLATTFADEATQVRASLGWVPDLIWTSPASRCVQLAQTLGCPNDARIDPRLGELHMGAWEGRTWDTIRGPEAEAWFADPWRARPPGGETVPELLDRVAAVRTELTTLASRRVAVVTHAGVIRAWRSLAEGRPLAELFREPIPFGSIWPAG